MAGTSSSSSKRIPPFIFKNLQIVGNEMEFPESELTFLSEKMVDFDELDVFEKDTRYRDDLLHLICTDFSLKGKVKGLTDECRVLFKIILAAISPRVGGTDTISWTHRHLLYFLLTEKKVNLGDYFFERICEAIFASKSQRKTTIVYPRLLSDLLHQGHVVQNLRKFHPELVEKRFYPEILNANFLSKMRLIASKPVAPPQEFTVRLEDRLYVAGYPLISEADAEHVIQGYLEVLRQEGFVVDRSMIPPAPVNLYNPKRKPKRKADSQDEQVKPDLLAQKKVKVEQSMAEQRTKRKHEETANKAAEGASKKPIVIEEDSSDSSSEGSTSEDETESDEETLATRLRKRPAPTPKDKGKSSKYDPCRPGVNDSVQLCQKAGVKVKMVTGDNVKTAKAIAVECGILSSLADAIERTVIEGKTFRALSDSEREEIAD
ncbi:unnamed protein product [Trifolium pratense]|uniref:Uncharacterized protein n=1 Tax=Trifolium pratense TaxID=57577 RepID=A0ACB0MDT1_TRIPR|nr:unnamed protein product [Trifolium pratense]